MIYLLTAAPVCSLATHDTVPGRFADGYREIAEEASTGLYENCLYYKQRPKPVDGELSRRTPASLAAVPPSLRRVDHCVAADGDESIPK